MPKYTLKTPVKLPDGIHQEGDMVELDEQSGAELIALGAAEEDAEAAPARPPRKPRE